MSTKVKYKFPNSQVGIINHHYNYSCKLKSQKAIMSIFRDFFGIKIGAALPLLQWYSACYLVCYSKPLRHGSPCSGQDHSTLLSCYSAPFKTLQLISDRIMNLFYVERFCQQIGDFFVTIVSLLLSVVLVLVSNLPHYCNYNIDTLINVFLL